MLTVVAGRIRYAARREDRDRLAQWQGVAAASVEARAQRRTLSLVHVVVDDLDPGFLELVEHGRLPAGRARAEQLTWQDTARQTADVYRAVLSQ